MRFRDVPDTDQANMDGHVDGWSMICRDEALIGCFCAIGRVQPNQNAIAHNVTLAFGASEKFRASSLPFVKYGRDKGVLIGPYLPYSSVVVFPDAESLTRQYRHA